MQNTLVNHSIDTSEVKYGATQMIGLIRTTMKELGNDYEAVCFLNNYVKDMCATTLEDKNRTSLSLIFIQAAGTIWCDYADILNKDIREALSKVVDIKIKSMI